MASEEATEIELPHALGEAIAVWAQVEHGICQLFSYCTVPFAVNPMTGEEALFQHKLAVEMFYAVENFRSKLSLVDAAITTVLSDQSAGTVAVLEEWERVLNKARKLSLKRNRLAHWVSVHVSIGAAEKYAALVPPAEFGMLVRDRQPHFLDAKQILDIRNGFITLVDRLHDLGRSMSKLPALQRSHYDISRRVVAYYHRSDQRLPDWLSGA